MADSKISALTTHGTPVGADFVASVLASGPSSRKLLLSDLRDYTGLVQVAITDAAVTMAVNTMYVGSIAGFTADRTYTLPTTAAVGDRIGIMLTAGDDTYELLITAATSDTLNGVAGGTEWSRLFITGETVIMRCVTADTAWIVEHDGRIPQLGSMSLTGSDITTSAAGVYVGLNLDTVDIERGCKVDVAVAGTSLITWRRASYALISGNHTGKAGAAVVDNEFSGWGVSYGGIPGTGTALFIVLGNHPGTLMRGRPAAGMSYVSIPAGSEIQIAQYTTTTANLGARALTQGTNLSVLEILA